MTVSGRTRLYGLMGDPVTHSLSPFIMNHAFECHRIDAAYVAFSVPTGKTVEAVRGLQALNAAGANVTYPHKTAVLPLLDHPSLEVEIIQAANTLQFTGRGVLGFNSDVSGTVTALRQAAAFEPGARRVFIFGAGGAARAAAYGVLQEGADSVTFAVRDPARCCTATAKLRAAFPGDRISIVPLAGVTESVPGGTATLRRQFTGADLVINATPVGMGHSQPGIDPHPAAVRPDFHLIPDADWIRSGQLYFDFVYSRRETAFLAAARARGADCLGGIHLLVAQAAESFRHWTGRAFDLQQMRTALEKECAADSRTGRHRLAPRSWQLRGRGFGLDC